MNPTLATSDVTAALGFLLTLTSLLGTFFYVHLSNWFRDILELKSKVDFHARGDSERDRQARTECRFQLRKLLNHVPLLISVVMTFFIVILYVLARRLITLVPTPSPVWSFYTDALNLFLLFYIVLSVYFLIFGYKTAFSARRVLNPPASGNAPRTP